jgi:hypothetical protein
MFPDVRVTPDGRMAITYYDASSPSSIDYVATVGSILDVPPLDLTTSLPLNASPFRLWNTQVPYDSRYNSCFGLQGNQFAAPGSGLFMAWADGSDPGPVGNNGIDPNIRFAKLDPSLPSATTLSISTKGTTVHASGRVSPDPVLAAKVTVILYVDEGNGFRKVDTVRPTLGANGSFGVFFTKPGAECRLHVTFGGSEGRLGSSISKTFAC